MESLGSCSRQVGVWVRTDAMALGRGLHVQGEIFCFLQNLMDARLEASSNMLYGVEKPYTNVNSLKDWSCYTPG